MDKVLTVLGRTFISAGTIVFLFVGYQLWGTNITEARAQDQLQSEVEAFLTDASLGQDDAFPSPDDTPATTAAPGVPNTTPAPPPAPQGAAIAVIRIPKIGLQKAVVNGTSVDDLKRAPGHYTGTPLPGQPGNAAIAGHRTTYGAPFGNLDRLRNGDVIEATTRQGTFRYKVDGQQVVDPSNVSVLDPTTTNKLTLTTCHPKYSAAKRLIVTATLDDSPAPAAAPTARPATPTTTSPPAASEPGPAVDETTTTIDPNIVAAEPLNAGLSGEAVSKMPAIFWGALAAAIAFLTWASSRLWRRVPSYIVGTPLFFVVLFVFFENFSRLLPANA